MILYPPRHVHNFEFQTRLYNGSICKGDPLTFLNGRCYDSPNVLSLVYRKSSTSTRKYHLQYSLEKDHRRQKTMTWLSFKRLMLLCEEE